MTLKQKLQLLPMTEEALYHLALSLPPSPWILATLLVMVLHTCQACSHPRYSALARSFAWNALFLCFPVQLFLSCPISVQCHHLREGLPDYLI